MTETEIKNELDWCLLSSLEDFIQEYIADPFRSFVLDASACVKNRLKPVCVYIKSHVLWYGCYCAIIYRLLSDEVREMLGITNRTEFRWKLAATPGEITEIKFLFYSTLRYIAERDRVLSSSSS